jgi:hypothetical protein
MTFLLVCIYLFGLLLTWFFLYETDMDIGDQALYSATWPMVWLILGEPIWAVAYDEWREARAIRKKNG